MAALVGGALISGAHAAGSCSGTLGTALLHPLPNPVTVALQTSVDDSANPVLAQRFVDGLQRAGVAVSPQGNMTLSLTVSLVPSASASSAVGGTYKGFDWVSGEQAPGQGTSIRSANLSLSVTLTDNTQSTQSWIATAQCVVQTDDSGALAEDIGEVIGRNIGQNFDSRRI
jgi:hypothetical protein